MYLLVKKDFFNFLLFLLNLRRVDSNLNWMERKREILERNKVSRDQRLFRPARVL
jgi:hypothetical protein